MSRAGTDRFSHISDWWKPLGINHVHMLALAAVGLFAFFLANVASLMVSGQILADPAIATLLGMSIGFVLSLAHAPAAPVRASSPVRASLVLPAARAPSAHVTRAGSRVVGFYKER